MKHDDILTAARNRLAEIDAQVAELTAERAKLAAMVSASDGKTGSDVLQEALRQLVWPPPPPAVPTDRPCAPPIRIDPWFPYVGGIITTSYASYDSPGPVLSIGTQFGVEDGTVAYLGGGCAPRLCCERSSLAS